MRACVSLLALLCSACAPAEGPAAQPGSAGPVMLESSAPSSEPRSAVPAQTGPAEEPPPAKETPPPAKETATPTPASASETAVDLTPRILGATGPDAEKFYRAEAMRGQGDPEAMRRALMDLVKDHPTSKFMPQVFLMLGDESFERGEFKNAVSFYERVLTYPNDDTGAYAHFKAAWCQVNLGNHAEALAAFIKAAERAQRVATDQGRALARASLRDSVLPYAQVGKLDRATAFYKRVTPGTAVTLEEVLTKLAVTMIDTGRRDEVARECKAAGMPAWCAAPLDRLK